MLAIEKWARGKNPVIAFFAINHALMAREKSEALRHLKDRRIYGHQFPLPDLPSWFSLYRSRKPIFAYKRLISSTSDLLTETTKLLQIFRKLIKNPDLLNGLIITGQDIEESLAYYRELCSKTFDEIKEDIAAKPLSSEFQEKFRRALVDDELSLGFYFLVYAPCTLFYETSPATLYRKALNRDLSAIKNLLMIDPLLLHDPSVGFQIQSVRLYGKTNDYERILAAITRRPKLKYKKLSDERRSIKSDHGAMIYALTKAANKPLGVPQIRSLYDALAYDYTGTLIDLDISKPEGFDKTIKTKAANWQKQRQ